MMIVEVPLVAFLEYVYRIPMSDNWHNINMTPGRPPIPRNAEVETPSKSVNIGKEIQEELERRLAGASERKVILIWAPAFGNKSPFTIDRKNCGNCVISFDKAIISESNTAAVLFHFDTIDVNDMPPTRYQNQLHVFWDMEASANLMYRKFFPTTKESYDFNATMTYRLDSDFLASYQSPAIADLFMEKNESSIQDILKSKSKMAMAIISDCSILPGARMRLKLIKELRDHGLNIDLFGSCFYNRISKGEVSSTIRQHKFYFAYENSYHCKDYITEKLFTNAYGNDVVPVVWGAEKQDYEAIAPRDSFIFAEDFSSPEELIQHLEFLDKNDDAYMKYFRWRTMGREALPQYRRTRGICALCRALHGINVDDLYNPGYEDTKIPPFSDGIYPRSVPSLLYWFYGKDNPECFATS